jgi:hypothetical protein
MAAVKIAAVKIAAVKNGQVGSLSCLHYLREPRRRFFNAACRRFMLERFGLVMRKVPLPRYSA